jgi:hypothetical protein
VAPGLQDGRREGSSRDGETPLPAYFKKLSPGAKRIFLASNAITQFDLVATPRALELNRVLTEALTSGVLTVVERAAQVLLDELCRIVRLPRVGLQVKSVRPQNQHRTLHGIFYPRGKETPTANPYTYSTGSSGGPLIILWMRTAQRHDVVRPKTFLRTLMHEFGHYLDYALLRLGDSPHTPCFFKRESFLVRILAPGAD